MNVVRNLIYGSFGILTLTLLFTSYPLALIPPGFGGLSYYLRIPSIFILAIHSILLVLATSFRMSKVYWICFSGYLGFTIYHILITSNIPRMVFESIGILVIPLAFCLCSKMRNYDIKLIANYAFGLWFLLTVYGFMNYFRGEQVIGITGNRNWMAISLLSLFPWAIFYLYQLFSKFCSWKRALRLLSAICILLPGLFLMGQCFSRGAWVALGLYGCLFLFHNVNKIARFLFILGAGIFLVFALGIYKQKLIQAYLKDVRLPIWVSSFKLIYEYPFGVGPGNYVKIHSEYLAKSEYHRRSVATELTTHPHNEFIHVAACLGFPAAIFWLITLFPLIQNYRNSSILEKVAQFSAFVIYAHAMLDKPLVQPPSNIIGLCCLGLCWRPIIKIKKTCPDLLLNWRGRIAFYLLASVMLLFVFRESVKETKIGWNRRLAAMYRNYGNFEKALTYYQKIIRIAPNNIKGYYGAGAIAVQKVRAPKLGLSYLLEAAKLNPNYAHLNRLIGKAYGTLGNKERALNYFERDCQLFPTDIHSYQNYYMSLVQNDRYESFFHVRTYLDKLYIEKTDAKLSGIQIAHLAERWFRAVDDGEKNLAIQCAKTLCNSINYQILNPVLIKISKANIWKSEILYDDFNEMDYHYWKNLLRRDRLLSEMKEQSYRSKQEIPLLKAQLSYLNSNYQYRQISAKKNFWTSEMDVSGGNLESFTFLLAWILQGQGKPCLIQIQEKIPNKKTLLVFDKERKTLTNGLSTWGIKKVVIKADAGDPNLQLSVFEEGTRFDQLGKYKMFFFPQEFLPKNQILMTLLHHYAKNKKFPMRRLPEFEILKTISMANKAGLKVPLYASWLSKPFQD